MKTYPVLNKEGLRSPAFQVDNIYVGPTATARLLLSAPGVTDVQQRKAFSKSNDIHVEFKYLGRPYIVWEPYGDNSRYWIGPADMVEGASDVADLDHPSDIDSLEDVFRHYHPPIYRALIGDVLTLRFITRFLNSDTTAK